MPLFEFTCQECKETHELLVRGSEKPACPKCGSKKMEKQASHFAPMSGAPAPPPGCGGCANAGSCAMRR